MADAGRFDIDRVKVLFAGDEVGTLAQTPDGCMAFEYTDSWLARGFSISPLSLPLEKRVFIANPLPFDGAFGVFDDSLPDGWGRLLVDRALAARGIEPARVGLLARLSLVGANGMGALEYEPDASFTSSFGILDYDELAERCADILSSQRPLSAAAGESGTAGKTDGKSEADAFDELFALGGSSGGARPKVLAQIDGEDWVVKFPSSIDVPDIGAHEHAISLLAKDCGVEMPQTRLLPSKCCAGYFAVRRFDRTGQDLQVRKVHMVSAGGLLESSHRVPSLDYELLMRLAAAVTDSARDVERLYRLMCFNVFIGNRDDHAKNFSFLFDAQAGCWTLSPAYDLTNNPGTYGERATTVGGKGKGITTDDLVAVGVKAGIGQRRARQVAQEMRATVKQAGFLDDA